MKPDYTLCDKCGAKANTPSLFLETGSSYDGVESRPSGKSVDLCEVCMRHALILALEDNYDEAFNVLARVERRP